jgi:Big-like domain-containing protein
VDVTQTTKSWSSTQHDADGRNFTDLIAKLESLAADAMGSIHAAGKSARAEMALPTVFTGTGSAGVSSQAREDGSLSTSAAQKVASPIISDVSISDVSGNQDQTIPDGGSLEIASPFSGTISFEGATGTLKIDDSATFSGSIAGQLTTGDAIDLTGIHGGANATVTYSGNNSPGTVTVSDGTHSASISLEGNYSLANFTVSSDGHGGTILVDPPIVPTITSFSTDSGVIGDHTTNDASLTLTGTAAASSTVQVYDGTTLLGSTTSNASGNWSYTTGTLSNGTHSFTAATGASGGTTGAPSSFPDASTTGVRDGVTLKASGGMVINTAGAVISGLDITGNVVITAPNVTLVDCKVTGNISLESTGAVIQYCDVVGQNTTDTIDINPNGVNGQGANTTIANCDISGSENGIWLEANGAVIKNNYIHNLFSNNGNPDPHIDGIQVPGANIGAAQTSNAVISGNNIDLDVSTANSCLALDDVNNFNINNNRFNGGSYVVYFGSDEPNGSTGNQLVNNVFAQYTYGYVAGQAETAQTYSGNVTSAGVALTQSSSIQDLVPGGSAKLAQTASSTTTETSSALVITVDTVAPVAPKITSSVPGSTSNVEVLKGTAEANSTVTVFDGTTKLGTVAADSTGAWSFTTTALATGSHSFTATATDAAGNTGVKSSATTVTIAGTSGAPGAPTIASFSTDSGVVGDHITDDSTLTLQGTAVAGSTVNVFDGTTLVGTTTANSSGAWTATTSMLADGSHSLTATDSNSGGTSAASAALSVTIDTHAPSAPTIAASTSAATLASTHVEALTGTAEAGSTVTVFDGTTALGTATANGSGAWNYTTKALSTGDHSFTATATDVAGNTSSASAAATVKVAGSSSSEAGIEFTNVTNTSAGLTIQGTADPNSALKLFDGNKALGSVTTDSNGAWKFTNSGLANAVHSITAQEVDNKGNVIDTSSGAAIIGTSAGEKLVGTSGDDFFVGKGQSDTFVFAPNFGNDVIKDFNSIGKHHDVIQFNNNPALDNFASVLAHASQVGQDVVISSGSDTLTLKGVKLGTLDSHDFHFS